MPLSFFSRKKSDDVNLKGKMPSATTAKPTTTPFKQPDAYQMTGWDWAKSIATFGIYYWCVIKPKKTQKTVPAFTAVVTKPQAEQKEVRPESIAQEDKTDPWAHISQKLILLTSPLQVALESGDLLAMSEFQKLLSECKKFEFLKKAVKNYANSNQDEPTRQLNFINELFNIANLALQNSNSSSSVNESFQSLKELRNNYTRLRTKLIFKQNQTDLAQQLSKPAEALNGLKQKLTQLETDTPTFHRIPSNEVADEKTYDINELPELSPQNDPTQYLKQRIEEFNGIQRNLQSTLANCEINLEIHECALPDISATQDNPEETLKAAMANTSKATLETLQQLKDKSACAAITGEIDHIINRYTAVLAQTTEGATLAATYRQEQLRHAVRQSPALHAYSEQLKSLLDNAHIGAAAAQSGTVVKAKSAELEIVEQAAAAIQQLPIPGIGFAANIASRVYGYVSQLRQDAQLNNVLLWRPHLNNEKWLKEFVLMATIAKRNEIIALAAKGHDEIEKAQRVNKLTSDIAKLENNIKLDTPKAEQLSKDAAKARKQYTQEEDRVKSKSAPLRQYKIHEKNIAKLTGEMNSQIAKINDSTTLEVWGLIQAGAIKSTKDPRLTKDIADGLRKNFQKYVEQYNKRLSSLQELNTNLAKNKTLIQLNATASSATSLATEADKQLLQLSEKLKAAQDELNELKLKATGLKEQLGHCITRLKDKAGGLKDKLDKAFTAGLTKTAENAIDTCAGKATAIQDFTQIMTQIANEPGPEDNTSDSATSRLLAYLHKEPGTKASDGDIDPAKASKKGLHDYFFYNRKTQTSSHTDSKTIIPIRTRHDHFDFSAAESTIQRPITVQTDYFGKKTKPDESKPFTPDGSSYDPSLNGGTT